MNSQEFITKNKSLIINILILGISLFIALKIYNNQVKSVNLLEGKKTEELKKNEVAQRLTKIEKNFNKYEKFLGNKDSSLILNAITDLARESSVEIISLSPGIEEPGTLYVKYPFNLKLTSDSYHKIGKFIAKLESHPFIFTIQSFSMIPQINEGKLSVTLQIKAISVKDQK